MIKEVKIFPRMAIHSLANQDYYARAIEANHLPKRKSIRLISINGNDEPVLTADQIDVLRKKYGFTFIHSMVFDDIGDEIWESIVARKGISREKFILFNHTMADEVVSFIEDYEPKAHCELEDEALIVHCHAGISRSAAIGAAIACSLDLDPEEFRDLNPNIDPNKFILAVMLEALDISQTRFDIWRNSRKRRLI